MNLTLCNTVKVQGCIQYEFTVFKWLIFKRNTQNTPVHENDNIFRHNENLKPLIGTVNCVTVKLRTQIQVCSVFWDYLLRAETHVFAKTLKFVS